MASVGFRRFLCSFPAMRQRLLHAVVFHAGDMGVEILNHRAGGFPVRRQVNLNVKNLVIGCRMYLHRAAAQRLFGFFALKRRHVGDYLQPRCFVPGDNAQDNGGFQSLHTVRVGDNDAFYVFDNVAADI